MNHLKLSESFQTLLQQLRFSNSYLYFTISLSKCLHRFCSRLCLLRVKGITGKHRQSQHFPSCGHALQGQCISDTENIHLSIINGSRCGIFQRSTLSDKDCESFILIWVCISIRDKVTLIWHINLINSKILFLVRGFHNKIKYFAC